MERVVFIAAAITSTILLIATEGLFFLCLCLSSFVVLETKMCVRQRLHSLCVANQLKTASNCWWPKTQLAVNMLYSANKPSVIAVDFILQLVLNTVKHSEKVYSLFCFMFHIHHHTV